MDRDDSRERVGSIQSMKNLWKYRVWRHRHVLEVWKRRWIIFLRIISWIKVTFIKIRYICFHRTYRTEIRISIIRLFDFRRVALICSFVLRGSSPSLRTESVFTFSISWEESAEKLWKICEYTDVIVSFFVFAGFGMLYRLV